MTELIDLYRAKISKGLLHPDPEQEKGIAALSRLAQELNTRNKKFSLKDFLPRTKQTVPRGVYLHGGVGRGKTMMMDMFYAHITSVAKRRLHFHDFMQIVHDALHARRKKDGRVEAGLIDFAASTVRETPLLCLDELMVEDVADAMILTRLFQALFDRGGICVMTSNLKPEDLYRDGLQRDRFMPFIHLLRGKLEVVDCGHGTDHRLSLLHGTKLYLTPDTDQARRTLDDLFVQLSGGHGTPARLNVKGRNIDIPRAFGEVAFFTFDDLCATPRGAADYLELTRHYRVILLAGVPPLHDGLRNETKRFIILIDTLYDKGVRLILSAAVPLPMLYEGEEYAFAFARTTSRLTEMQARCEGEEI